MMVNRTKNTVNRFLGDDVSLFLPTGLSYFTTREDAEKCLRESGGDIRKYVNVVLGRDKTKNSNYGFGNAIRDAAIGGVTLLVAAIFQNLVRRIDDGGEKK
jgi:hypothetical protein